MNDEEIWQTACERVGFAPRIYQGGPPHPPLGSPDAVVKMLERLAPKYAIIKKIGPNWQVNSGDWSDSLPLAIAAAVCALPEEK